jgi:chromosome segregation ATPase
VESDRSYLGLAIGRAFSFRKSKQELVATEIAPPAEFDRQREPVDLDAAFELLQRASEEIVAAKREAAIERQNVEAVVAIAREKVAEAHAVIDDLRERLSENERETEELLRSLRQAREQAANMQIRADRVEAQLASLQGAIWNDLSDKAIGALPSKRRPAEPLPIFTQSRLSP